LLPTKRKVVDRKERKERRKKAELVKINNTHLDDVVLDNWNFNTEQSSLNPIGYTSHPSSEK
jgi:hypothetical protein